MTHVGRADTVLLVRTPIPLVGIGVEKAGESAVGRAIVVADGERAHMHLTRLGEARPYEAAGHFDMRGLRLQGAEAGPSEAFWVGLSCFLPGGGAESDAGPIEKVYVVVEGEMTVETDEGETTLGPFDSCHLEAGERRSLVNRSNRPATMVVVMPYPKAS